MSDLSFILERELNGIVVEIIPYDRGLHQSMRCPICRGTQTEHCPGFCDDLGIWYPCENGRVRGKSDVFHSTLEPDACNGSLTTCRLCCDKRSPFFQGVSLGGTLEETIDGFVEPFDLVVLEINEGKNHSRSNPLEHQFNFAIFEKIVSSRNGNGKKDVLKRFILGPLPWVLSGPRMIYSPHFWRSWKINDERSVSRVKNDYEPLIDRRMLVSKSVILVPYSTAAS